MNISDPISDLLTRIRNAGMAEHSTVAVPHSKMKESIAGILKDEGYITSFEVSGEVPNKTINIRLKYSNDGKPIIRGLRRVSKPGLRCYVGSTEIPRVQGGLGIGVLSTSHGVLTDRKAREANVGGEFLCEVW